MFDNLSKKISKKLKKRYTCKSNITVFGASKVGKSTIARNFATSIYSNEEYRPTLTEMYEKTLTLKSVDGKICTHNISLLDTLGTLRTDFSPIYRQIIQHSEAFVLVFSFDDEDSLDEIEYILRDIDTIKKSATSPILIVANKLDTVNNNDNTEKLNEKIANINRGFCFAKSAIDDDFTDSFVSLLTEIERRKGIDRSFYGVQIES